MTDFSIFNVFTLLGGLAFFLYGMNIMSSSLEMMAGGNLQRILGKMTSNSFKSILFGAGITVAIQSSSALTVILVGLVNSGIMELIQTIPVIMGSNIGTTFTTWITSLTGLEATGGLMQLLKPESFSPIVALIGIILVMMAKSDKKKSIGSICLGFAILMYGMILMSGAVSPLRTDPGFISILTTFSNPFLGVIVSTVFTGIIQSSAATIAILQTFSIGGAFTFNMALPLILGANIGTCATALLSSIGVNRKAKRVAVVHVMNKIIGTVIFLLLYYLADLILDLSFANMPIGAYGIALTHTVFNVVCTIFFLPFTKQIEKLGYIILPEKKEKDENNNSALLDDRLLLTPSFAVSECNNLVVQMGECAKDSIISALGLLNNYSAKKAERIFKDEQLLDSYEDKLGTFLVKLSQKELTNKDSMSVSLYLHSIGDFERLGDHAINLVKTAKEINEKDIKFSDESIKEINVAIKAIREIIDITVTSYSEYDIEKAKDIEPLEQVVDVIVSEIKSNHITRLRKGNSTIEHGFILNDLLTNFERISDHCSNIAATMIETSMNAYETHEYLNSIKTMDNKEFKNKYLIYSEKYHL